MSKEILSTYLKESDVQTDKHFFLELVPFLPRATVFHDSGALPNKIWVTLVEEQRLLNCENC